VSDPYIIEGFNITVLGNSPVQIENSTVFFEIRGCLLVGGSIGILLQNVTNAKVWNTIIRYATSSGILVTESDNVIVTNNTISGISGTDSSGVYSLGSNHCEFSNNTIGAVSGWNILIDYSHNCSITDNYLGMAGYDGIRLRDSSKNNITLNEITHSHLSGIKLGNSHSCRIVHNIVEYSVSDGISIEASSECHIADNVLFESGGYSLDIAGASTEIIANTFYRSQMQGLRTQSNNNNVTQNNFIENNLALGALVSYIDNTGSNNDVTSNYYDTWTWPDEDENDIVDQPYPYGGGQSDFEPHVKVFQTDLMHILTRPRLIYPNETMVGTKFWGLIRLLWGVSSDSFGHDATYNVSVSTDGGSTWIQLAHDLSDTDLEWNASEFSESAEYKFKVVAQCTEGLVSEYTTSAEYEVKSHTLSVPTVLTPNGGETISGEYEITWTESVESWNLPVSYDIYYSSDAGDTWTEIINSHESTSITWGVRGLPEGDQYLIRVVARSSSGFIAEDVSDSVFTVRWSSKTIIIVLVGSGVVLFVVVAYALRRRGTIK
jgi:parallel beta-helix repeat protein